MATLLRRSPWTSCRTRHSDSTVTGRAGRLAVEKATRIKGLKATDGRFTGEVAERFNAAVSKAVVPQGTGGSNPSLSAIQSGYPGLLASPGCFPRASLIPKSPESFERRSATPCLGRNSLWAILAVSFGRGPGVERYSLPWSRCGRRHPAAAFVPTYLIKKICRAAGLNPTDFAGCSPVTCCSCQSRNSRPCVASRRNRGSRTSHLIRRFFAAPYARRPCGSHVAPTEAQRGTGSSNMRVKRNALGIGPATTPRSRSWRCGSMAKEKDSCTSI